MGRVLAGTQLPRDYLDRMPRKIGGLYFLYERKGKSKVCFYIGISKNLRQRLMDHPYWYDFFSFVKLSKKSRGFPHFRSRRFAK